jgi:hypothetical protein
MATRPKLKLPRRCEDDDVPPGITSQRVHTDDESEFITAVLRFRTINKVSTPTLSQLLWILKQIGYQKIQRYQLNCIAAQRSGARSNAGRAGAH